MPAPEQSRPTNSPARAPRPLRERLRPLARKVIWRVARPYARRRARKAEAGVRLGRLETDLYCVTGRHDEQLERLEDLVRELVLTAEALRRDIIEVSAARTHASDAGRPGRRVER
jgi:hypothetical protein